MDSLQSNYKDEEDEESVSTQNPNPKSPSSPTNPPTEPQNYAAQEPQNDAVPETQSDNDAAREPENDAVAETQNDEDTAEETENDDVIEPERETQPDPMVCDNDRAQKPQIDAEIEPENEAAGELRNDSVIEAERETQTEPMVSDSVSEDDHTASDDTQKSPKRNNGASQNEDEEEEDDEEDPPPKKQKQLSSLTMATETQLEQTQELKELKTPVGDNGVASKTNACLSTAATTTTTAKKSKKKNNNVWVSKTTRKGKKKSKANTQNQASNEDTVLITPVQRFPDKGDDNPEMKICLSKVYKAEKVELSEDRMSAGSTKGYRMVRATRGVAEGAWYYEIKVVKLGETGHTRLGWSMEKGDLQAPVGYDGNSFGYRDIDGSKIHKALREKYGEEGYKEGDVIGFYINLPEGGQYAPKPPHFVWYKGQRYVCAPDAKEDPPKVVPGSEISFFKNGVCQGVAFKDLYGGRYYPAASMYTLPNQPNCLVKFNFGPDFEFFPEDFGECPMPRPMIEVPYHGFDSQAENGVSNEKKN
ncbi:hypothetical protein Pint_31020 [Pistacia integerrima]|uniref:Uncharacterized protein n=1 Tax=Pistacia integerrima TaxID=434235 RepID=A0ACC0XPQ4_9ROSI|nr:hypothetical protein Pint_31020 [Pistacia integerrima]